MPESTRFALAAIFSAITNATSAATGRPVDELAGHLLAGILKNNNAPQDVKEFLSSLAGNEG